MMTIGRMTFILAALLAVVLLATPGEAQYGGFGGFDEAIGAPNVAPNVAPTDHAGHTEKNQEKNLEKLAAEIERLENKLSRETERLEDKLSRETERQEDKLNRAENANPR